MRAKTIHLPEVLIEEAQRLHKEHKEQIRADRKAKHMPGPDGENHILRMAIELGMPLVSIAIEGWKAE
jgi:hypothetical protein